MIVTWWQRSWWIVMRVLHCPITKAQCKTNRYKFHRLRKKPHLWPHIESTQSIPCEDDILYTLLRCLDLCKSNASVKRKQLTFGKMRFSTEGEKLIQIWKVCPARRSRGKPPHDLWMKGPRMTSVVHWEVTHVHVALMYVCTVKYVCKKRSSVRRKYLFPTVPSL